MKWGLNEIGMLCLTAYDGAVEIATLYVSGNDGTYPIWNLRTKYATHGFDILAADTEEEAKEEALDIIRSGVEDELAFAEELLKMLGEMESNHEKD